MVRFFFQLKHRFYLSSCILAATMVLGGCMPGGGGGGDSSGSGQSDSPSDSTSTTLAKKNRLPAPSPTPTPTSTSTSTSITTAPAAPTGLDFGGMYGYGWGNGAKITYRNPATGTDACPSSYTAQEIFDTYGVDWPVYACVRPHVAGQASLYDFGGMYGISSISAGASIGIGDISAFLNPLSQRNSCAAGYSTSQVLGTSGTDWPLYFCYRPSASETSSELILGGFFGFHGAQNDGTPAGTYPNTLTSAASCSAGFATRYTFGTANTDFALAYCTYARDLSNVANAYFVSNLYGSDSNSGSLTQPFKTIQRAANLAGPGNIIYIREGIYRETVTPANSGTASAPIIFKAYPGEVAVINGADIVSGLTSLGNGLYSAAAGASMDPNSFHLGHDQIFLNGAPLSEARYPASTGDLLRPAMITMTSVGSACSSSFTPGQTVTVQVGYDASLYPGIDFTGGFLSTAIGARWASQSAKILSASAGSMTISLVYQGDCALYPRVGNTFNVWGLKSLIGQSPSWFIDANRVLFVKPGTANFTIEAKHRQYAFNLSAKSNIQIDGINLFASTIVMDPNSTGNRIDHLVAKYVSHYLTPFAEDEAVEPSGIILDGTGNTLRNSIIQYSAGDGVHLNGDGNQVLNSYVQDVDYSGGYGAAVSTTGKNHKIYRNTLTRSGRCVVQHAASQNVQILNNDISWAGYLTDDLGGTYAGWTDGGRTIIAYNVVHDILGTNTGIYLDNYSLNSIIAHNIVYNVDTALRLNIPATNIFVFNNTFDSTVTGLANVTNDYSGASTDQVILRNNIFFKPRAGDLLPQAEFRGNIEVPASSIVINRNGRDYRLAAGSSAIDKGITDSPFTDGYAGSAADVGAIEYGSSFPATGASGTDLASIPSLPWAYDIASVASQPIADFGGMFGWGGNGGFNNPAIGSPSCPSGYSQYTNLGTYGTDWPLYGCVRKHQTGQSQAQNFLGLIGWGYYNNYPNAATNTMSCPAGATSSQILGTSGTDYNVYLCSSSAAATPATWFGGSFGYGNDNDPNFPSRRVSPVYFLNPVTGGASCPSGYRTVAALGTSGSDYPLYYCYR